MLPNEKYLNLDLSFWANVKLLNQRLGYLKKNAQGVVEPVIPTISDIVRVFDSEKLNYERLVYEEKLTDSGKRMERGIKISSIALHLSDLSLEDNPIRDTPLFNILIPYKEYRQPFDLNKPDLKTQSFSEKVE